MIVHTDLGVELNDMSHLGTGAWLRPIPEDVWRDLVVAEYRHIHWVEQHSDLTFGEYNDQFPSGQLPAG